VAAAGFAGGYPQDERMARGRSAPPDVASAAAFPVERAPMQPDTAGLPIPQRYWAVFTVAVAITMAVLDGAIANIALPTIARDLQASPAASVWVVNAYQLAITISLLPLAALGEIVEYRRVYRVGLIVFTLASLACAGADSLVTLTLARIVQGFGAAGIMSVNGALVRFIYPRSQLGRGIGINALVVAVSAAVGPTVAALILAAGPWQWLFAVNVPFGIVALLAAPALPRTRRGEHRFDVASALLNAAALGLLITAIQGIGHGVGWEVVVAEFAAAAGFAAILVWRQFHQAWPLLPIDLLRIPVFALSIGTSVCSFLAQMLAYVSLPFYLQDYLGRSEVETGLLMTPWPLATAVAAPIAGRLADRYPAGALGGVGLAAFAAGLALLAALPPHPAAADIVWRMIVCGFGFGLFQSPNNRAILGSAPPHRSGGASGMLGTARLLGQTTGAALVALIFGFVPGRATTVALLLGAGVAMLGAGVSSLRLLGGASSPAPQPAPPGPAQAAAGERLDLSPPRL
jgi:DHA2 family multidrug resistance protein-like MFS transporter